MTSVRKYIQCKLRVSKRRKFAAQAPSLMGCTVVNMSGCVSRWDVEL